MCGDHDDNVLNMVKDLRGKRPVQTREIACVQVVRLFIPERVGWSSHRRGGSVSGGPRFHS